MICSLVLVAEHCLWHESESGRPGTPSAGRAAGSGMSRGGVSSLMRRKAASILWDGRSAVQHSRGECTRRAPKGIQSAAPDTFLRIVCYHSGSIGKGGFCDGIHAHVDKDRGHHRDRAEMDRPGEHALGPHPLLLRLYRLGPGMVQHGGAAGGAPVPVLPGGGLHPHPQPEKVLRQGLLPLRGHVAPAVFSWPSPAFSSGRTGFIPPTG